MRGFINETHFASAERQFPGIRQFYEGLQDKPTTFLELVWQYIQWAESEPTSPASAPPSPTIRFS